MMPTKRKKWTEAEEKTLIEKYGEMVSDGSLGKMKTREKKYKPIALFVNSVYHSRDPIAYPWQWTWKDVSTKVQNMRHQYLLVKQKIKKPELAAMEDAGGGECSNGDEFDWVEGLTHWPNFLRYKEIFGDVPVAHGSNCSNGNELMGVLNEEPENTGELLSGGKRMDIVEFGQVGNSTDGDFAGIDGGDNGMLGLGFDYEEEDAEENYNGNEQIREGVNGFMYEEVEPNGSNLQKKKKKVWKGLEKRVFGFLSNQFGQLREMEARFEQREVERKQERKRREDARTEREHEYQRKLEEREKEREEREKAREKLRRQRLGELEAMEKESEERERRRREEELIQEREWEERMSRRRMEWKKRMDEMLSQHRSDMGQMQTRILHEQQSLTSQLLGIFSQWTGHATGLSDHTGANSHYLSQMMQNLHHVSGMVHGDARVDGDTQDDQFIVDG